MYEVEVKVRADHDAVRDRLAALDAEHRGGVVQTDAYYDHPGRSFAATDEALRIRRETADDGDASATLTYKGPRVDDASKTREEIETGVRDADALDAVLRALDFEPVADVRKERDRYAVDGYTVTLDEVAGLGAFVEAEIGGEEAEIDRLREGARDVLSRLGLDPDEGIRDSYLELLLRD